METSFLTRTNKSNLNLIYLNKFIKPTGILLYFMVLLYRLGWVSLSYLTVSPSIRRRHQSWMSKLCSPDIRNMGSMDSLFHH